LRQQRLGHRPFLIRQVVTTHGILLSKRMNQIMPAG
jgi:hypothetical protein